MALSFEDSLKIANHNMKKMVMKSSDNIIVSNATEVVEEKWTLDEKYA